MLFVTARLSEPVSLTSTVRDQLEFPLQSTGSFPDRTPEGDNVSPVGGAYGADHV
jgi:hypothetical protein